MYMRTKEISNTDDIIDSRNVIKRIEELQMLVDADDGGELEDDDDVAGEDEREELKRLKAFEEEASGASDWIHGACFIHESYFEEYAQQTASDLYGKEIDDARWPFNHIDWKEAAEELKIDYTVYDFDGETYYCHTLNFYTV